MSREALNFDYRIVAGVEPPEEFAQRSRKWRHLREQMVSLPLNQWLLVSVDIGDGQNPVDIVNAVRAAVYSTANYLHWGKDGYSAKTVSSTTPTHARVWVLKETREP